MHIIYIHDTNETNNVSMNDYVNVFHKYNSHLISSNNKGDLSTGADYD